MNTNTNNVESENAESTVATVPAAEEKSDDLWASLTEREKDVALSLARGDRNRDIAQQMGISVKTVDTHRTHVLKKLKCRHNVDLARLAIRLGWVENA